MSTRQLSSKLQTRLEEQHQSGIFFSLKATFDSDTIFLWSGYEDLVLPTGNGGANETYLGSGDLIRISEIRETRELKSDGISIQLSYITPKLMTIATTENYQNRPLEIRMGFMDAQNKDTVAGTIIIFKGRTTNISINDDPTNPTIEVQAENRMTDLSRPSNFRYTNESQNFISGATNDTFMRFVKSIQDKEILWGRTTSSGGGSSGNAGGDGNNGFRHQISQA